MFGTSITAMIARHAFVYAACIVALAILSL
jgi:hypothetical protein